MVKIRVRPVVLIGRVGRRCRERATRDDMLTVECLYASVFDRVNFNSLLGTRGQGQDGVLVNHAMYYNNLCVIAFVVVVEINLNCSSMISPSRI